MRSWNQPTAEDLTALASLAGRPESRAYFFDHLQNPEWVTALDEVGFFEEPPEPVSADELGYSRFPPWPEGRYLARMAPLVPEAVTSVLIQLPDSQNPVVTRLYLQAAAELPDDQLRQVAHKVHKWIWCPSPDNFADEAASVICQLLRARKVNQAVRSAGVLLRFKETPDPVDSLAAGDTLASHSDVVGHLSDWEYESVVKTILPALVEEAGLKGLKLFACLLDSALWLQRQEDEPDDSDGHSMIWRPAIEDHPQNHDHGIRDVLVSATRDAAVGFAKAGEAEITDALLNLEARSVLHRRIALHVLATSSHGTVLASKRITDREMFEDHRLRHEYATLVRSRFSGIPAEAQQIYLGWVREGPDLEEDRRQRGELGEPPPSDKEEAAYVGGWQRDRLSFAASHLDGEDAHWYRQLVAEFGEPDQPDFVAYVSSWEGPESPVSKEEMSSWSAAEIVDRLRTWRPDERPPLSRGPSIAGLGRVFKDVAQERVAEFVPLSNEIGSLEPTYVRSFLQALDEALRKGVSICWVEPLRLMHSVVEHPFEPDRGVHDRERDPGWRWSRGAVPSVLNTGFSHRENRIPLRCRDLAWRVLERLTKDPDPSPSSEANYGDSNMDLFSRAINSNRGRAIDAVIHYALWCRRELEAEGEDPELGFDLMPEVRSVLERHLDPEIDPSPAIRSIYGRWLPWLLLLDEAWVAENLARILPTDPGLAELRAAVWATYIVTCPPYNSVFRSIQAEYAAAVNRVPSGDVVGIPRHRGIDVKLGEHLVTLYSRDVTPQVMLDRFFQHADDDLAATVMENLGRTLLKTDGEIPTAVGTRIQQLWQRRLDTISHNPEEHRRESQAFAMTFAAAKLAEEWELTSLSRAIPAGSSSLFHGLLVMERLAQLAANRPLAATRLTLELLCHTDNEWRYLHWREEVQAVLVATADSGIPEVADIRQEIVDRYLKRGEYEFRELL